MFKSGCGISETSREAYKYRLSNFVGRLWPDKRATPDRLQNYKMVLGELGKMPLNTARGILIAILKYLGQFKGMRPRALLKYREALVRMTEDLRARAGKLSDDERDKWIDWKKIYEAPILLRRAIDESGLMRGGEGYFKMFQKYVVLMLYTRLPPLRADYADTRFGGTDNGVSNFMDPTKGVFILRQYKTAKWDGPKVIDIGPELLRALREWAAINKTGWLLVTSNGRPMSPNTLSKYVIDLTKGLFGKKVGPTMFRKIYLSTKYPVEVDRAREVDAEIMGHNLGTQNQFYRKPVPRPEIVR